jgi:ATP-dependent protease HslVU (ClpYQ) peptidase subunit
MTLILAIPTKEGVVIASDGQVTYGQIRWQEKKIKQLNEHCL